MKKLTQFIVLLLIQISINAQLTIGFTSHPPSIDGSEYDWGNTWTNIDKSISKTTFSGKLQLEYDNSNLYLIFQINDSTIDTSFNEMLKNDFIEFYLSLDTISAPDGRYKTGDWLFRKSRGKSKHVEGLFGDSTKCAPSSFSQWIIDNPNFKVAEKDTNFIYTQEWQLPWPGLAENMDTTWDYSYFKFDIKINDAHSDYQKYWYSVSDLQDINTEYLGLVKLDVLACKKSATIDENIDCHYQLKPFTTCSSIRTSKDKIVETYPNPVKDILTITLNNQNNNSLKLYNSYGVILYSIKLTGLSYKLNFSDYPNGVYILEILSSNEKTTKMIVKY